MPMNFEDWFHLAKEDLDSAELLYKNSKFPQATFFLQQAEEKMAKGYMLKISMIPASKNAKWVERQQLLIGKVPLSAMRICT